MNSIPPKKFEREWIQRLWLRFFIACLIGLSAQSISCVAATKKSAIEYFVDSRTGSDKSDGTKERPWRSLDHVGKTTFHPGDTIYFVRGSVFEGGFEVNLSGAEAAPITFKAFGDGPMPRFSNRDSRVLTATRFAST